MNTNLHKAKQAKNDEFYTRYKDIENELKHYTEHFRDKVVYCNCDNPEYSNFWKYFVDNFEQLGLKKLIATYYNVDGVSCKTEHIEEPCKEDNDVIYCYNSQSPLRSNGDFRSQECIDILKEADVVVSNPPFSCYSSDTEVKTNHGWKLFSEVNIEEDLILSVNPDTKEIEYVKAVDKIVQFVNDELLLFKNRQKNLLVTKNHKMWAYAPTTRYVSKEQKDKLLVSKGLIEASELKKEHCLPVSGFNYSNENSLTFKLPSVTQTEQYSRKEIIVPEKEIELGDWLEFLGFYLADGCYRDHINTYGKRDYTISIAQNVENDAYVKKLIKNIGFTYRIKTKDKNRPNCANYDIYSKQLWTYLSQFGRSESKFVPEEFLNLSPCYLKRLLIGYQNGDSNFSKDGKSVIYSSRSRKLMDNVQEILLKIYGQLDQVREVKAKYKNQPYIYYKIVHTFDREHNKYTKYGTPEFVPYSDNVYCLQLERNHVMLVRREGTVAWCGNCFREYVAQLMEYDKKFLIIGNMNAVTYKEIFPLIKDNKIWPGFSFNKTMEFIMPDDYELKGKAYIDDKGKKHGFVPAIAWYTNLDIDKRHKKLELTEHYNPEKYPKYDNYDVIEVNKTKNIPYDYNGIMAVPISWLDKYCPEQFEIIEGSNRYGILNYWNKNDIIRNNHSHGNNINGKATYFRIHIRRK